MWNVIQKRREISFLKVFGMTNYHSDFSDEFRNDLKKIKDVVLQKRLRNKTEEILENPYHYKPLRNVFKNKRRAHIGSFVLLFEVIEDEKKVVFLAFQHHDLIYKNK